MSVVKFDDLPDHARLWIFACERKLAEHELAQLHTHMEQFMANWTAHKRELTVSWKTEYTQFLFVAVDEAAMAASGCSIDSLVHSLQSFEQEISCDLVNTHSRVFYRDEQGKIRCVERFEFKALAERSSVTEDTIVFNNIIQSVGELRQNRWEVPMKESWHMQAFGALV